MATKCIYLCESYLKTHVATVASVAVQEALPKVALTFDSTIFYPQGGGQPSDVGHLHPVAAAEAARDTPPAVRVAFVSNDRSTGTVTHAGELLPEASLPAVGDRMRMEIDWPVRYLHMRLHSAGHLIDHACHFLGLPFKSLKANHFPSGPAVEFLVPPDFPVDKASLADLAGRIEARTAEILAADPAMRVYELPAAEVPEEVWSRFSDKARVHEGMVRLTIFEGCPTANPCGGTHVARASEVGAIAIKKITHKDGAIRVSYRVQ